ncbi:MAG: hypothetical protein IT303_10985 [Dehalococcoidia bacterium]|nr:hypothetical protein [Dehalococcoidia bacterium]
MAAINHPLPHHRRLPIPVRPGAINWWVIGAIAVFGVGAALPVIQNSTATSRGFDVQRLEAQQVQLNGDIRQIESEVAALTSLQRIERRAGDIGLVPGSNPIYIEVSEPGPAPAKIPAEYLPGPVRAADEPEPWWRSLLSWVSLGN